LRCSSASFSASTCASRLASWANRRRSSAWWTASNVTNVLRWNAMAVVRDLHHHRLAIRRDLFHNDDAR